LCWSVRGIGTRLALAAAAVAIVLAGSAVFGGVPYARALYYVSHMYHFQRNALGTALHYALASLAVVGTALALLFGVWLRAAAWSFVALGVNYYSWYAAWGLPFILASRRYVAVFLISLPVVGSLVFAPVTSVLGAPMLAVLCLAIAAVDAVRQHRDHRQSS
jgi:hypothetical protein